MRKEKGGKDMYAIIETGGKQLRVEVGQTIYVEKLGVQNDETYTFEKVLLVAGETTTFGAPYVEGATVTAKVLKTDRGRKIRIYKYKAKHNERKRQGHRQPYTALVIENINL